MRYQKRKYMVNGWEETEGYFLSFGFTWEELDRMIEGATICKEDNEFWIIVTDM